MISTLPVMERTTLFLWLDTLNLYLPFEWEYDMIFYESMIEMEIYFEEKRNDFYCVHTGDRRDSVAWFPDFGTAFP